MILGTPKAKAWSCNVPLVRIEAMSPFAEVMRELRLRRGLRQEELALRLGCGQRYVSSIEIGSKGPPGRAFVDRLTVALNLDASERAELDGALARSCTRYALPPNAPRAVYEFAAEFFGGWDQLHPAQLRIAREAISIRRSLTEPERLGPSRITRRDKGASDVEP